MSNFSHPYKDHEDPYLWPEGKENDIEEFYKWILEQPNFPKYTKNHAHLFLNACLWNVEDSKRAITRYSELRAEVPECFDNRDTLLPNIQRAFNVIEMVELPKRTEKGYAILVYRLSDFNPSKIVCCDALKAFTMFNDVQISVDGPIPGYIVIFDMKGVKVSHLSVIQFGILKKYMAYVQQAHPFRLKKLYIVHCPTFVDQVFHLFKPLIEVNLGILKLTKEGPISFFPAEVLPEDYGGKLPAVKKLYADSRHRLENEYRDWLIDSKALRAPIVMSKKSKKSHKTEHIVIESIRTLEID